MFKSGLNVSHTPHTTLLKLIQYSVKVLSLLLKLFLLQDIWNQFHTSSHNWTGKSGVITIKYRLFE